jgi:hypothetical protein
MYRAEKLFVVITDENRRVYGLTKQIVFAECAPYPGWMVDALDREAQVGASRGSY